MLASAGKERWTRLHTRLFKLKPNRWLLPIPRHDKASTVSTDGNATAFASARIL